MLNNAWFIAFQYVNLIEQTGVHFISYKPVL